MKNFETMTITKFENYENCDKTQIATKCINTNCDQTQKLKQPITQNSNRKNTEKF